MSKKTTAFDVILYIVFAIISLIIILPIWKVVVDSFNAVGVYKFLLWPTDFTLGGYQTILGKHDILDSKSCSVRL